MGYMKRRKTSSLAIWLRFLSIFIIFVLLVSYSEKKVEPHLKEISQYKLKNVVTAEVHNIVFNKLSESASYEELVKITRASNGSIMSIELDMAKMNSLTAEVSSSIQSRLSTLEKDYIAVPLGALFGNSLLAGLGPDLNIRVRPYGSTAVDYRSEFISEGINQTVHRIYIDTKTTVGIAVPLYGSKYDFTASVPVAETVIVGNVPEAYLINEDIPDH